MSSSFPQEPLTRSERGGRFKQLPVDGFIPEGDLEKLSASSRITEFDGALSRLIGKERPVRPARNF
ncbi:hypothetical protein SAM23877_3058 [Streptomyces ambofaciens ATCC 23877]|uniref:Uncharacterized protein n=1 Tax=Streptomyces ambofaciens (strain ATCC 23877 / 3486 / DSM 40053 / JCM 4204 / NBRC 12836 / NRRL B-2516) TaxID=278992 RepID=A0A0K2ATG9_STRA7|nr:hypothetical protein SAM23877_3058 [Streptomyces ambofaciens ATCC 23877]